MSTSSELMYAILAMDAYNRGYNPGLVYEGNSVGTATVTQQSETSATSPEVAAGFYAVSYEWNGETIISYRGTDNPDLWTDEIAGGSDVWNGYGIGVGSPYAEQGRLAAEFYQAATGSAPSWSANFLSSLTTDLPSDN